MVRGNEAAARTGRRVTLAGILVNAVLIGLKFAGGVFGQSQALIADAVHSVSDFFTDIVALVGLAISSKAPDEEHPFGHARLETLATAVIGLALIVTAVGLALDAADSIYEQAVKHPTWLALAVASISILSKEALYRYTIRAGRRLKSPVLQANARHHRSDALSSVAVLAGLIGTKINPKWQVLDPLAALLVSFFILKAGFEIIRDCARELTDTAPSREVLDKTKSCAQDVPGVINVHGIKVRTSGGQYQMELHIVVDGGLTVTQGNRIAKQVETCLLADIANTNRVIIHVDPDESGEPDPPKP